LTAFDDTGLLDLGIRAALQQTIVNRPTSDGDGLPSWTHLQHIPPIGVDTFTTRTHDCYASVLYLTRHPAAADDVTAALYLGGVDLLDLVRSDARWLTLAGLAGGNPTKTRLVWIFCAIAVCLPAMIMIWSWTGRRELLLPLGRVIGLAAAVWSGRAARPGDNAHMASTEFRTNINNPLPRSARTARE
jgi:hypothetical protein